MDRKDPRSQYSLRESAQFPKMDLDPLQNQFSSLCHSFVKMRLQTETFETLPLGKSQQYSTSDPCNGNHSLPLSEFLITSGHDHTTVHDKMVSVDPTTTVMAFVSFFPCPGELVERSCLLHAPALHPGRLAESTPFDRKAYAFSDDVSSGTAPLVEFRKTLLSALDSSRPT